MMFPLLNTYSITVLVNNIAHTIIVIYVFFLRSIGIVIDLNYMCIQNVLKKIILEIYVYRCLHHIIVTVLSIVVRVFCAHRSCCIATAQNHILSTTLGLTYRTIRLFRFSTVNI